MRIALLGTSSLDYPSPRGRWLPLAQHLVARGDMVRLFLLHHRYDQLPRAARREERGGVVVYYAGQMHVYGEVGQRHYFGPLRLLRVSLWAAVSLALSVVRSGCDVLHLCKPQPINGLAGILASRALRCPLYLDCDDYEAGGNRFSAEWQKRMVQLWEDTLPLRALAVTVNTRFLQQRCEALGVPARQVVYVPNGVNREQIESPPPARAVAGLRGALGVGDDPLVVYVGTLSETTHNVGLLLDAFTEVVQQVPAARLLLVGDGEDRTALAEQARRLGIAPQVRFVGAVSYDMVPLYLALATCSVDAVRDDAVAQARSPLKIVESLAAGVPVVTGDVGDRADMLADGAAGVLVAPGDAGTLAQGIVALLQDPTRREAAARAARRSAQAYAWPVLATKWSAAYDFTWHNGGSGAA